jgi:membrane protein YqaA with SNARE-associated domain
VWAALASMFASAFGAATLLPIPSEPLFIGLLLGQAAPAAAIVLVACIGNTLGAVVNWWLGLQVDRFQDRRWFPATPAQLEQARGWYRRWGRWSLLLSWAPVIGDPLTVVAGVMRERLLVFVLLVGLAKTARYVTLALITLGLT